MLELMVLHIIYLCVVAKRELKTNFVIDYKPYSFKNSKNGPDGFAIDLIKAVAAAIDYDIEIHVDHWPNALKALEKGDIDLLPPVFRTSLSQNLIKSVPCKF